MLANMPYFQHSFYVVRSAGNTSYNFVNPVVRDVVSTGTGSDDIVTIRFFTDNPGPWFLHCHIDWHLNLYVVFCLQRLSDVYHRYASGVSLSFSPKMFPTCQLRISLIVRSVISMRVRSLNGTMS